ncbi:1-acyl-sn-glycerol-3-phosphate acyltransferase [Nocardioides sp. zg-1228]|uniref:lysophospholipid acyltransferase family protein n=1 Tax=Nocardioides sp. zg-1228 TaxID=2763008 RepID=UPI0016428307|nr:lysophospholipid acyltransferase family protein [Nocardioides sp. zg-1228]MBC2932747.1 1-acyl-sn-glycerol-3-phosphate acyltransferase [Nocardioides sp. zg-1228]QSF58221.1 1-acyl-sn-glycerol-3-phosphate acyltransferase [Nocardioides sp. zg-1228]
MSRERTYRAAVALGRVGMRALRMQVTGFGAEHVPRRGPVLLAATHVSYPDFVFVQEGVHSSGRHVRFMTRHDVWQVPGVGRAMSAMRHIPVDRAAPAGAYLTARRLLREGEAVCAFPEAGISYSYTVRSLMRGVASLARETGVPVVPVALWGAQRVYSVGVPDERGREPRPDLTRGRRIDVSFGPPLTIGPDEDLTEWTCRLGEVLTEQLEELQRLPHHRPRPGEHAPWYPAHLGGHAPTRDEAAHLDIVPRAAIRPTWGPTHETGDATPASRAGW